MLWLPSFLVFLFSTTSLLQIHELNPARPALSALENLDRTSRRAKPQLWKLADEKVLAQGLFTAVGKTREAQARFCCPDIREVRQEPRPSFPSTDRLPLSLGKSQERGVGQNADVVSSDKARPKRPNVWVGTMSFVNACLVNGVLRVKSFT